MINVCFITDNNYIIATMTAIKSLIYNNKKEKLSINVVCYKLTDDECKQIQKLKTKNANINIVDASDKVTDFGKEHFYVSKSALLKFYLPIIFSDEDKILYLDGDLLINSSIKDLYNTNLDNLYAAVVKDIYATKIGSGKALNLENYFNSGVMLLNLKKMREDNITEKLIECKKNEVNSTFMDQNAFNKIFNKNVTFVSLKYNYMIYATTQYNYNEFMEFYGISYEELQNITNKFIILHLAGLYKPWKYINYPCFKEFIYYLLKLPNCKIKKSTIKHLFRNNYLMLFKYYLRQNQQVSRLIDVYERLK